MMGTRIAWVAAGALLAFTLAGPVPTYGTAYDPLPHAEEATEAPTMAAGATVYLFHSGTEEVRRSVTVGDVLVVARPGEDGASPTGRKVRVVGPAGAVCVQGEVLEGKVRVHDVATGKGVYFLVVPQAVCGR